jgi:hypothetical protein
MVSLSQQSPMLFVARVVARTHFGLTKLTAVAYLWTATSVMLLSLPMSSDAFAPILLTEGSAARLLRLRSSSLELVRVPSEQTVPSRVQLRGGDYAGLLANFDVVTGKLIPVPEHLVPASLLEWGDSPLALEILVSEDDATTAAADEAAVWNRQTITILPATGCGVDNLETTKTLEQVNFGSTTTTGGRRRWFTTTVKNQEDESVVNKDCWSLSYPYTIGNQRRLRLEACFKLEKQSLFGGELNNKGSSDDVYRSRLEVDLLLPQLRVDGKPEVTTTFIPSSALLNPIRVCLERQTSTESSGGTVADGGGLDGQRVSQWLGPVLSSQRAMQAFAAEQHPHNNGAVWRPITNTRSSINSDNQTSNKDILDVHGGNKSWKCAILYLPGNLTLAVGSSVNADNTKTLEFVEMGQIYPESGLRQVLRHQLLVGYDDDVDDVVVGSSETAWLEKGQHDRE